MDINEIKAKYNNLNMDLRRALGTMERKDSVFIIKEQIRELQSICPHCDNFHDFSKESDCPYCGRKFKG